MKELMITVLYFFIFFYSLFAGEVEKRGVIYDLKYSLKYLIEKSDLIFVGSLEKVSKQVGAKKITDNEYKIILSSFHLDIYKINVKSIIKGKISEGKAHYIAVDTSYNSATNHLLPTIDDRKYIFLLKHADIKKEGLPEGEYYELIEGWRGMIALEREAISQRSVQKIKETYGVSVLDNVENFLEIVKMFAGDKMEKAISQDILKIYEDIQNENK